MKTINLDIENLHCNGCKNLIERSCMEIEGVEKCEVSLETNSAIVEGQNFEENQILSTINTLGKYVAQIKNPD